MSRHFCVCLYAHTCTQTKQLRLDIPQSMQAMDVDMCDAGPVDSSPAPSVASLPQGTFLSPGMLQRAPAEARLTPLSGLSRV